MPNKPMPKHLLKDVPRAAISVGDKVILTKRGLAVTRHTKCVKAYRVDSTTGLAGELLWIHNDNGNLQLLYAHQCIKVI